MNKKVLKRVCFFVLFVLLVYFGNNVNFSALVGANSQFFTLFQFFGPIAGGFLGLWGGVAVLFAELLEMVVAGKAFALVTVLRLFPMVFGALYFALMTHRRDASCMALFIVPSLCILLFVLHPIGRTVWFFSLFWTIPIIAAIIPKHWKGQLFFRSYGATFTAHAVGGAIWIYAVPMAAEQWIGLIPIVAYERFLFGLGIAISYVAVVTVLDYVVEKLHTDVAVTVEKPYTLPLLLRSLRHFFRA